MYEYNSVLKEIMAANYEYSKMLMKIVKNFKDDPKRKPSDLMDEVRSKSTTRMAFVELMNFVETMAATRLDFSEKMNSVRTMLKNNSDSYKDGLITVFILFNIEL
jgi:hypothetical protein